MHLLWSFLFFGSTASHNDKCNRHSLESTVISIELTWIWVWPTDFEGCMHRQDLSTSHKCPCFKISYSHIKTGFFLLLMKYILVPVPVNWLLKKREKLLIAIFIFLLCIKTVKVSELNFLSVSFVVALNVTFVSRPLGSQAFQNWLVKLCA